MQSLRWHFLVASLIALPLTVNATWAGTHDRDLVFEDLRHPRDYGQERERTLQL